jgi:hypothetical protein
VDEIHRRGQGCRERYASLAYGLLRSFLRHIGSYTVMSVFSAKAAVNTIVRVDRTISFTPVSLSGGAVLLVSDGGGIRSLSAARKISTSIGFLFCIQAFPDEFGEHTPRALAISHGIRSAISSIRTAVGEEAPADGESLPAASEIDSLAICAKLSLWHSKARHHRSIRSIRPTIKVQCFVEDR